MVRKEVRTAFSRVLCSIIMAQRPVAFTNAKRVEEVNWYKISRISYGGEGVGDRKKIRKR